MQEKVIKNGKAQGLYTVASFLCRCCRPDLMVSCLCIRYSTHRAIFSGPVLRNLDANRS